MFEFELGLGLERGWWNSGVLRWFLGNFRGRWDIRDIGDVDR